MKAIVHQYKTGFDGVEYKISPERALNDGEVKVKLKSAGLNHRDLFIINNRKEMDLPLVIIRWCRYCYGNWKRCF